VSEFRSYKEYNTKLGIVYWMRMYLGVDKYRLVWYTIPKFAEKSGKTKQIWRKKNV